jgi:hypothetical protein
MVTPMAAIGFAWGLRFVFCLVFSPVTLVGEIAYGFQILFRQSCCRHRSP